MMIIVFTHYLGGMFYLNIVLHVTSKNKTTWDQMLFTGLYSTVFIIGAAVSFGTQFYGQVSLKLGGAKPQTVRIGLSDDALKKIPTELVTTDRQLVEGKLIHQNSSHLYFSLKESTVRIRASDVVSLILKPEPEKNIWGDWIKPQSK
ncbi:hypothetical protein [Pseudacidovorax sp. NFM-22]|uniref:hypothetical protein n=1 Tax=Pseudacidovorax sp. NFM-22 TaxID=2744469 RepID=UPI001F1C5190|nr:hypothetical protein [Pseudacidovorax sp. NFM-22]